MNRIIRFINGLFTSSTGFLSYVVYVLVTYVVRPPLIEMGYWYVCTIGTGAGGNEAGALFRLPEECELELEHDDDRVDDMMDWYWQWPSDLI